MRGFNVLHPMGWDRSASRERYAMTTGIHPAITTAENISTFRRQIKMLGLSYDLVEGNQYHRSRIYKWTQWIFLKIYNSWYDAEKGKTRPISDLPFRRS